MSNSSFKDELQTWQRLSPMSVVFFIGKLITHLVKDLLPAMAPLIIIIFNSENKLWITTIILISVITLILVGSFLQYWFFKFKQEDNKVLINDGVFKKNHRVIQFDRIQNINILQPLYFKPFDLVTLQIETAGAKGNEADLAGISKEFAEYLRNQVLQQQHSINKTQENSESFEQDKPQVISEASLKDLIKYGISSNGVFWFFVIIAPVIGLADDYMEKLVSKEDVSRIIEWLGGGFTGNLLMVIGALLMTVFLMFTFSILGAILRYFRYQLVLIKSNNSNRANSKEQSLKRSSGLLTSYEESLKLQKVQSIITQSNFIGCWLKVNNLTLGQVSTGQANAKNKKSLFVIPARTSNESSILQEIIFDDSPNNIETNGISKRYINKTILFKIFLPSLLICSVVYYNSGLLWLVAVPFLLSLIILPLVIKRWRAYQFGMKDGYGIFQRGLFGFRHVLFPLYKIQRVEVQQSPIQRRRDLATLKIYLASNRLQMQYIPIEEANRWLDIISRRIEKTRRAWY